jgi:hypothetical protein
MMSILALPLTLLIVPSLSLESDTAYSDVPKIPHDEACLDSLDIAIFNSPRRPHKRAPMQILVGLERPGLDAAKIVLVPPEGAAFFADTTPSGGPPWGLRARVDKPTPGKWRAAVIDRGEVKACQEIEVGNGPSGPGALEVGVDPFWESRIRWERDVENLYSLWIEHLFDAPLADDVSWNPLALVLKDPARNLLYDHLGLGEDKDGLRARPDCADFPYTLRAYFAWKMGLPMAMRNCRRGNAERAPTCGTDLVTNELPTDESNRVAAFRSFLRKLSGTVHSSSLRGAPNDPKSDFYPVRLDRDGLRPGTIYADPYGHTMMVLRWYPQTAERAGVLMAVDAQPDGTVGRRVFWKGAFLFPKDDDVAGAGWKRFRPVRKRGSELIELDNAQISESADYGDYSTEQWESGQDGFYEAMDALISPAPMSPEMALSGLLDALHQQALRRVESIEAVRPYFEKNSDRVISMPDGSDIFLTAGPWEDYSTPSRDMRMLIAIDTVQDFAARVARRPERFILDPTESAEARAKRLADLTEAEAKRRTLTYLRSDGSARTLTLADLMTRELQIELAWNPNDCPEFRWGAPEGSEEFATCKRRAPAAQQSKMATMRAWFEGRQRPLQH